jgi:REP element-mobilizing transposase RayT
VLFGHITARGNRRQSIFLDDSDRRKFFWILEATVARWRWRCHAYCLMTNHYHLLVETDDGEFARGMLLLNGWYARFFNLRHGLTGHVFQGPYDAEPVLTDEHLMETCRYIVRNPVRAGVVAHPGDWPWSSYRAAGALERRPAFLTVDTVRGLFGSPAAYRTFCNQVAEQPGCAA